MTRLDKDKKNGASSMFKRGSGLSGRTKVVWLSLLLCALVGWAFYPAIWNGYISLDDPSYVTDNVHVTTGLTWENLKWAATAVVVSNWHPLTMVSHMLDCQLFGLAPWGHHLTNVVLHMANTVLLFLLLKRMTRKIGRSFFVAALFGLHPLHVESVAWVSERKDVLSTLFWMLTTLAYVKFVEVSRTPVGSGKSKAFYCLTLGLFALGLMSKPMLVTLPCTLLLLDYWPLGRFKETPVLKLALEKWPFFVLTAISSVITFAVQDKTGAVVPFVKLAFPLRVENAAISYVRYLGKFFYPANLYLGYPFPARWPLEEFLFAVVILAAVSTGSFLLRRRQPWLLIGWLWFVGTLVPVIGLVQVGQQAMADRYTYVPLIGIFIFVTWEVCKWAEGRPMGLLLPIVASATIFSCVLLTRKQLHWWKNSETFFRHAIAVANDNAMAHNDLGVALQLDGRLDESIEEYRKALDLWPHDAQVRCNLGTALDQQGHTDEAIDQYLEALKLDPKYANAYNDLGMALNKKGRPEEAIAQFQAALRFTPNNPDVHYNFAHSLDMLGRRDEAIGQLQQALKLNPSFAAAHNSLGILFFQAKRLDEAIREFQAALKWKPDFALARKNLDTALRLKAIQSESPPASVPGVTNQPPTR